jgi:ABC-2 type transport system ATP-binding protein
MKVGTQERREGRQSGDDGAVIAARDLKKCFGERVALDGVSLSLRAGEVLGYVGPNGAGKTATLRILVGTETQFEGELTVHGLPMPGSREQVYGGLGYMPQDVAFGGWRSAGESLRLLGRLSGMDDKRLPRRISESLELVGLANEEHTRVDAFSGGMRQRLGLAQAILHEPRLLLLDEPFNHLDPSGRMHLKKVLAEQSGAGVAILFSSHILADVEEIVHRLAVLQKGKLRFVGTADELKRSHASEREVEIGLPHCHGAASVAARVSSVCEISTEEGGVLRVRVKADKESEAVTTRVLSALIGAGYTVRYVKPLSPTLEEIVARLAEEGAS